MADDACSSPARRLSQLFADYGGSAPGSPRLPARRSRVYQPPPPHAGTPPSAAALGAVLDRLHGAETPKDAQGWQDRCGEMRLELDRFKTQAARVRQTLTDKLSELERRVLDAEERAELAEDRLRGMMEDRVSLVAESSDSEQQVMTSKGPIAVIDKLETQVEEQRQLRLADARQVEAKAAKIKEWVTNKLRELEEQNQVLREQNQRCNAQLELLKNHLAHSSASLGRPSPRPLSQAASVGSLGAVEAVYAEVERRRSHRRHQSSTGVELTLPDPATRDSELIAAAGIYTTNLALNPISCQIPTTHQCKKLLRGPTHGQHGFHLADCGSVQEVDTRSHPRSTCFPPSGLWVNKIGAGDTWTVRQGRKSQAQPSTYDRYVDLRY